MATAPDPWDQCPWPADTIHLAVAAVGKSLLLARRQAAPSAADDQLASWFKADVRAALDDRAGVLDHLKVVRKNLLLLREMGFIPPTWPTSAHQVDGPECVERLVNAVLQLLTAKPSTQHPVHAFDAAVGGFHQRPREWEGLIDWPELPAVRALLDQFPPLPPPDPVITPQWRPDTDELLYGGRRARTVPKKAFRVRKLLDAFEKEGWPPAIDSPFGADADLLTLTLRSLRDGLALIGFGPDGGGKVTGGVKRVRWWALPPDPAVG